MTVKVLFVCLGNICRSPMAEGLAKAYFQERKLAIEVDSAATSRWEAGSAPHSGTQEILHQAGIDTKNMRARQVTSADFVNFDYIIGMDEANVADLLAIAPANYHHKIHAYLSVVPGQKDLSIPDPWYTGDFLQTKALIEKGLPYWQEKLQK